MSNRPSKPSGSDLITAAPVGAGQAWRRLHAISDRMRESLARALWQEQLTLSEFETLMALTDTSARALRISDIVAATSLSLAGISRLVARLEGRGLLARDLDLNDARVVRIHRTALGRATAIRARAIWDAEIEAQIARYLTASEVQTLIYLLAKLNSSDRQHARGPTSLGEVSFSAHVDRLRRPTG